MDVFFCCSKSIFVVVPNFWVKKLLAENFFTFEFNANKNTHVRRSFTFFTTHYCLLPLCCALLGVWLFDEIVNVLLHVVSCRRLFVFYVHTIVHFIVFSSFHFTRWHFFLFLFIFIQMVVFFPSCFIILRSNEYFVEIAMWLICFVFALSFVSFIIIIVLMKKKPESATMMASTFVNILLRLLVFYRQFISYNACLE